MGRWNFILIRLRRLVARNGAVIVVIIPTNVIVLVLILNLNLVVGAN